MKIILALLISFCLLFVNNAESKQLYSIYDSDDNIAVNEGPSGSLIIYNYKTHRYTTINKVND